MNKTDNPLTICDAVLYKEGSEACRNYSRLTMRVRTIAQNGIVGYVIAVSVAILGGNLKNNLPVLGYILIYAGIILGSFSASLALIDWHYQSAFTAMRDALAKMEGKIYGVWNAHACVRTKGNDFIASYVPFWVLWLIGVTSFYAGQNIDNIKTPGWTYFLAGVIFISSIIAFILIGVNQGKDAFSKFEQER